MKDGELIFDRNCHVLYSPECRRKILDCIAAHYPDMRVEPYNGDGPIKYKFHSCPVAEFARDHNLLDILPALCNADYAGMECLHARLVRTTTLGNGPYCDYAICGDQDPWLKGHAEYRDPDGARRNK